MFDNTIMARFIGKDRSMGLIKSNVYLIEIYTKYGFICVRWGSGHNQICPYSSIEKLHENWRII